MPPVEKRLISIYVPMRHWMALRSESAQSQTPVTTLMETNAMPYLEKLIKKHESSQPRALPDDEG